MKYKLIMCITFIMFTLSSCMFPDTSVDNLIEPQKLEKEQQEIYDAFINDVGENSKIDLLYPNNGKYLSSFVVENIDDTKGNEAIVFYKNNNAINGKDTISVNILDKNENDEWHSVWITHETEVVDIDKFFILDTNNEKLIVVGYDTFDNNKERKLKRISVMKYKDNTLQKIYSLEGNEFEVFDINNNGLDDLIIISDNEAREINVYEYNNNSLEKILNKKENYDEYKKMNIKTGLISEETPAIYIDETMSNGDIFTDILYYENGNIQTLNNINPQLKESTKRSDSLYTYDIDKDNIYEIPLELDLMGGNYNENRRFIKWINYDYISREMTEKSISYIDMKLGYRFDIPDEWIGDITYKKDDLNNEVTFYIYNYSDKNDDSQKLLKIKTFVPDINNTDVGTENYTIIDTDGHLKYGYILYNTNTKYDLKKKDIDNLFNKL